MIDKLHIYLMPALLILFLILMQHILRSRWKVSTKYIYDEINEISMQAIWLNP